MRQLDIFASAPAPAIYRRRVSPYFDAETIHVNDAGTPFERKQRAEFERGIEGDIEWMRHAGEYNDRVTNCHNAVFTDSFLKTLRGRK